MTTTDYIFIFLNLIGVLVIGAVFSTRMKNSKDMFVAGRSSAWWVVGLSGYMTIFSAGTFVVWGGIAYRLGFVAVSILMMIGFALILVGMFVAGKWREIGIKSPAEYLGIRFGKTTVTLYTIIGIIGRGVSVAVALYAVSILLVALIPLPEGHLLADPQTGNMSVLWAVLIIGTTAILYTVAGGLWAVLMIDVVQFFMLTFIIILIIPFALNSVGGLGTFIEKAPEGFFSLVSGEYSFIWLFLWLLLNFFLNGGDWPFIQRYISVPSAKDSRKAAFLMAALYIVTPALWMLPAMIYRVINPEANPEQAYILMSQQVLPAGMLGLMMAAMISATTSMIDSMLNVYASVFTNDIYRVFRPESTEKKLMRVGRVFTLGFGVFVIALAMLIPFLGGAERVVVMLVTLLIGPLAIPSIWGLFSRHIGQRAVWISLGVTYTIGFIVKFVFSTEGMLSQLGAGDTSVALLVQRNVQLIDALIGFVVPVVLLIIMEIAARKTGITEGWIRLRQFIDNDTEVVDAANTKAALRLTNKIVLWAFSIIGLAVCWLAISSHEQTGILIIFGCLLLAIPAITLVRYLIKKLKA
jgi:solute:Na+ symporter, SSS family